MKRGLRWLVAGALACASSVSAAPARADGSCEIAAFLAGTFGGAIGVGALTTAIGTGVTLGDAPPPVAWRSAGWVIGTLNLWPSALWLALADGCEGLAVVAIPQLSLTVVNFSLGAVATVRADDHAEALAAGAAAPAGQRTLGIGLAF